MGDKITEKTIGIHIMSDHVNYFLNILKLLETHSGNIIIFSKEKYLEKIPDQIFRSDSYLCVTKSESEPLESFLSRASRIWNSTVDVLVSFPFYYSIKDLYRYYKLEFNCTYLQIVYNVNMWTGSNYRFTPWIFRYLNNILRKQILSRADGILVEYSPIKKYLDSILTTNNVEVFTPVLYEELNSTSSKQRVTVPGHIDPARRNYEFFLDTVEHHLPDHRNNLEIHLLGSPNCAKGEAIANRCDHLAELGWNVRYHRDWVPIEQFEQILKSTRVIVSPIRETNVKNTVTEIYGRSKGSGSLGDAIRYGKPLALPEHYEVPPEAESIVRSYSDKSKLAEIIQSSLRSRGLSSSEIDQIERNFSLERQRKRFYDVLSRFYH